MKRKDAGEAPGLMTIFSAQVASSPTRSCGDTRPRHGAGASWTGRERFNPGPSHLRREGGA